MSGKSVDAEQAQDARGFRIYRGAEAPALEVDQLTGFTDVSNEGVRKIREAGAGGGACQDVRLFLEIPGFSFTTAWFKSGYPFPDIHTAWTAPISW